MPPEESSDFIASMENALEIYKRPYRSAYPIICMNEFSRRLIKETG